MRLQDYLLLLNHCHYEAIRQQLMSTNIHTATNHKLPTPQLLVGESVIILVLRFINNIAKTFFSRVKQTSLIQKMHKAPQVWFQAFQHIAVLFPVVYSYLYITNEARTKAGYRSRAYITWSHTLSALIFES